ncbi:MAG: hypothetical protein ACYSSO_15440, partial [Planctomycetota bacterium]
ATLASHWLDGDCRPPDWCEGADIDQDSAVNFVDFAFLGSCCIEVTSRQTGQGTGAAKIK